MRHVILPIAESQHLSIVPQLVEGAVPVKPVGGINAWITFFTGGSFLALLGLLIRQVGPWRKQVTDENQVLVRNLQDTIHTITIRLDKVERQLAVERRLHFIEVRRLEARNSAQRSLDRHKFGNREACLDALLRILELSPEKAQAAAKMAREQIQRQREGEQLESAEIHKAEIMAVEMAERELADQDKLDDAN